MEEARPLHAVWRGSQGTGRFSLFPVLFQTVWPLFEPLAPLATASPFWPLGCSPLPLPLPHFSPSPFILHLYLLDGKRPGTARLLSWEKEQSSHQPEAQMYCTGLGSPAESTKCFRRETHGQIYAVSSLLPIMCLDLGNTKKEKLESFSN